MMSSRERLMRALDREKLHALCRAEGGRPYCALPTFRW